MYNKLLPLMMGGKFLSGNVECAAFYRCPIYRLDRRVRYCKTTATQLL